MRNIYELETRQLVGDKFEQSYINDFYTSKSKALNSMKNIIDVNNGYCISDQTTIGKDMLKMVDYNSNANSEGTFMRLRIIIYKRELR